MYQPPIGKIHLILTCSVIKKHYADYMGHIFEQMCREYLFLYAENVPIILSDIGQWWGTDAKERKEVQIDIVGTPVEGKEYIMQEGDIVLFKFNV